MARNELRIVGSYGGAHSFITRWENTYDRVCPITGNTVDVHDVLDGKYYLSRINGDSRNGYEVHPTYEYLDSLGLTPEIIYG